MDTWIADAWAHLHTADGLRHTLQTGGLGVMALMIFAETGLLAGFFLPGDSLLVTAGVLTVANGDRPAYFETWQTTLVLIIAAIIGNQTGHWLGMKFGDRVENRPDGLFYKRRYLLAARTYFQSKGGMALLLARFAPILRTFVPFVSGMGKMPVKNFFFWNVLGAVLWISSLIGIGHLIGGTSLADSLHKVIIIVVAISFIPVVWQALQTYFTAGKESKT
jgi:membrane-associated protein